MACLVKLAFAPVVVELRGESSLLRRLALQPGSFQHAEVRGHGASRSSRAWGHLTVGPGRTSDLREMRLLYRARLGSQPYQFPSWAPEWTVPKLPRLYDSHTCGVVCGACGSTDAGDMVQVNHDELAIKGYRLDYAKVTRKATNQPSCWA